MKKFAVLCLIMSFLLTGCNQLKPNSNTQSGTILDNSDNNTVLSSECETSDDYATCEIVDERITISENQKTFRDSGITLSVPADWNCMEFNGEDGGTYFFRHPEFDEKCELRFRITLAELLTKKRTEKEYLEYLSYDNHKDVKITSFTKEKFGGYQSTKVVSSYSLENTEFIRIDYDYINVGFRLYSFTITYPTAESKTLEPIFNEIVNSIEFKAN